MPLGRARDGLASLRVHSLPPPPPPAQSQRRSSTRLAHRRADQVSQGRGRGGGGSEPSASRPMHLGPAPGLAQRGVRDAAMRDRGQGQSTRADDLPMGGGLCLTDGRWRAFTRRRGTRAGLELVEYLHDAPSAHAASVHVPRTSRDQTCLSNKEFGLVRDQPCPDAASALYALWRDAVTGPHRGSADTAAPAGPGECSCPQPATPPSWKSAVTRTATPPRRPAAALPAHRSRSLHPGAAAALIRPASPARPRRWPAAASAATRGSLAKSRLG